MSSHARTLGTFRFHLALTAGIVVLTFGAFAALLIFVPLSARFDAEPDFGTASYLLFLHESFWPVILGAVLASVASGLVLFERMRAPLRRFAAAYRRVSAGEIPDALVIRSTDYLRDEADEMNAMLAALRQREDEQAVRRQRIEQALDELESADLGDKVTAAVAEIREAIDAPGTPSGS